MYSLRRVITESIFSQKLLQNTINIEVVLQSVRTVYPKKVMENKFTPLELLDGMKKCVPQMNTQLYKGQCGRIGVVGGSKEYTGAPYFAGISALKVGADLSHIFCTDGAATVIKSYSPELIVHPILDGSNCVSEINEWLSRIHALVIGPGLGRDQSIFENIKGILQSAKKMDLPLVIDADGVYFVTQDPSLIKGYKKAILTPNGIEFIRLYEKVFGKSPTKDAGNDCTTELAQALDGVTVVCKGETDAISDGTNIIFCSMPGSARRCGGQGDLLSGSLGTFSFWAHSAKKKNEGNDMEEFRVLNHLGPTLCAAYGACFLTRECNRLAFAKHKRSTTTTDMILYIGQAFENNFET